MSEHPRYSKRACRESLPVAIAAAVLPSGWLLQSVTALSRSAASTICWARTRFDSSENWIRPHPRERAVCCHRLAWERGPASPRCEDWPLAGTHRSAGWHSPAAGLRLHFSPRNNHLHLDNLRPMNEPVGFVNYGCVHELGAVGGHFSVPAMNIPKDIKSRPDLFNRFC